MALARSMMLPDSMSAPRAFWAEIILSVSTSMRGGDKPQGDGHHHSQFMDRQVQLFEGTKALDGVGGAMGLVWCRSRREVPAIRQTIRTAIITRQLDALLGELEHPPAPQHLAVHKQHVEHSGEEDDWDDRLHPCWPPSSWGF